ncbi:MAG: hypothetical protein V4438_04335 [Patescibacteria group bacterium]
MSLKNSTSNTTRTFEKIQKVLSEHGANKIMFDYEKNLPSCITFQIDVEGNPISFRLPALIDNVMQIMYGGKDRYGNIKKITDIQREQAYRTGWANIRDWVDAQMALIDTKQVKLIQVFLPYAVTKSGQTVFEKMAENPQFLLGESN